MQLETNLRKDFTIMEKVPTSAVWLAKIFEKKNSVSVSRFLNVKVVVLSTRKRPSPATVKLCEGSLTALIKLESLDTV